jgi:RNA polymerase sigma-70 factor (family 1)
MDYKQASDIELWQCCRQDDIRAYNELFVRYAKPLYRQAIAYVHNDMDAEELVIDLLLNLWEKRGRLKTDAGNNVKAYLMLAMRNRIINHLQKNIPDTASIDLLEEDRFVDSREADYGIICRDMETIYQSEVDKLSPQRQKVFRLSREKNLSYAEIAEELNLSINTVENYMVSALNTLRENTLKYQSLVTLLAFLLAQ